MVVYVHCNAYHSYSIDVSERVADRSPYELMEVKEPT